MQVRYENHRGESISLTTWPLMLQDPESLYSNKWSYTSSSRKKLSFQKEKQERAMTLQMFADSTEEFANILNQLCKITEIDTEANENGLLWLEDDDNKWYLECNISASEYSNYEEDYYTVDKKITIIAGSWVWNKKIEKKFNPGKETLEQSGHGYPHDYPYSYSIGTGHSATVTNEGFTDSNLIITIYGYAYHPEILIDSHSYKLNCIVDRNQKVVINTRDRTIRLINLQSGVVKNAFMFREQASNIFEKISPGEHTVFWNTNFNFDITILIERSEPEWL